MIAAPARVPDKSDPAPHMTCSRTGSLSRVSIRALLLLSGFATLSWEVIWQIKSTLALGVSAWGTAITLAVTMGGMSLGGFLMGRFLKSRDAVRPLSIYGTLEGIIGISGLLLNLGFQVVERIDTNVYASLPGAASLVHILGIVAVLGAPTVCMGATLPVFGSVATQFKISIAELYGLNTLGAAVGSLFVALLLIPLLGITHSIWVVAGINFGVCVAARLLDPAVSIPVCAAEETSARRSNGFQFRELLIVFVTGFATFVLEIAWFRSLAATFPNSTDFFAMMLACVLLALGLASKNVPFFKRKRLPLGTLLSLAGVLILIATPLIERLDLALAAPKENLLLAYSQNTGIPLQGTGLLDPNTFSINWNALEGFIVMRLQVFVILLFLIGPPVYFLGMAFPWVLDEQRSSPRIAVLYALNTLAAIVGALGTAWILLPTIGFAKAAWIAGALVVATGVVVTSGYKRLVWTGAGIAALAIAIFFESGVGRVRVQGMFANMEGKPAKIRQFLEGPEATVSVIEYEDGGRRIVIDGSSASGQSGTTYNLHGHYMLWMGHLPMLLHPKPEKALVICFGTGQTANAVRKEKPGSLDIVDVNPRIYKLAHHFTANEDVLKDPNVNAIVMDGRAYLRRTRKPYDIITLEPMPPTMAGVNALYSKEFYELARAKMTSNGMIAQWLPFHCVPPLHSAAIARTFSTVFPNSILWMDPDERNGILLGTKDSTTPLGTQWPGFARSRMTRDLKEPEVRGRVVLDRKALEKYSSFGELVTDDNQLLSYGKAVVSYTGLLWENLELLRRASEKAASP